MSTRETIIKLQRPLSGNDGHMNDWLAYDRGRSFNRFIDGRTVPDAVRKIMQGLVFKAYFHAVLDPNGVVIIGARAPEQSW